MSKLVASSGVLPVGMAASHRMSAKTSEGGTPSLLPVSL